MNLINSEFCPEEFYPTPKKLVEKMLEKVDFKEICTVLESSAGTGNIIFGVGKKAIKDSRSSIEVDAIEIDTQMRAILKHNFSEDAYSQLSSDLNRLLRKYGNNSKYTDFSKDYITGRIRVKYYDNGYKYTNLSAEDEVLYSEISEKKEIINSIKMRIIHDDFLTYEGHKHYDLLIQNSPFSQGAKHLLKALDVQKFGGKIVSLVNAETIRNPYTNERKKLVELLDKYNADIEFIENAFSDAERKTDVEVALVRVDIPVNNGNEMSIFERMSQTEHFTEYENEEAEIEVTDFIQRIINQYRIEVNSGIELIRTYNRMKPYLNRTFKEEVYTSYSIYLTDCNYNGHEVTINSYIKNVNYKYWNELLGNQKFIGKLTSKLQGEYRDKINEFANYDFSEFNINTLLNDINAHIKSGIEEEIENMYDKLTAEHSYYSETQKNRYLYDGWKTNKAWKINKKVILPYNCYSSYSFEKNKIDTRYAYNLLSDIERILNYFDGNITADIDLEYILRTMDGNKAYCKFFDVTFYKKGTVHIVFKCSELIERFNIYVGKKKNWLPTSYGKKTYNEMTDEEKKTIDSFQGEENYNKVLAKKEYFLSSPINNTTNQLLIAG